MLSFFYRWADRMYSKKVDASGLAIFRIAFFLNFFMEVLQLFEFRHLMYDTVPFVQPADIDPTYILVFWLITIACLVFGAFTRVAAIINYLLTVHFMGLTLLYEYHMFHVYLIVNFVAVFIPMSRVISLDAIWKRLKYSNTRTQYKTNREVPVIAYYAVVFTGIGLVYFDSVFYKTMTHLWQSGLAFWLPCSVPMAVNFDNSFILNMKWLSIGLSFLTLFFEMIFIFVFFRKRWRWPVFILGAGLHFSIMFEYPIPWFALGYVAMYLLIVPISFWKWCEGKLKYKEPRFTFLFDGECPLCVRTVLVLESIDILGAIRFTALQRGGFELKAVSGMDQKVLLNDIHVLTSSGQLYKGVDSYARILTHIPSLFWMGWLLRIPGPKHIAAVCYRAIADGRHTERCTEENCGYTPPVVRSDSDSMKLTQTLTLKTVRVRLIAMAMILLLVLQANSTYNSSAIKALKKVSGWDKTGIENRIQTYTQPIREVSKVLWGITGHTVFLDPHFDGYNHIIAVEYLDPQGLQNSWLPITEYTGQPGEYQVGPTWARWCFRVNGPHLKEDVLQRGLRDFTAYWIGKTHHSFKDARFRVWVKYMDTPAGWEYNFLRNQMAKPWNDAGTVQWSNKEFSANLVNIEDIR
jgi:predicted DCC family thiol-disulfide oxidoreductase YuxK